MRDHYNKDFKRDGGRIMANNGGTLHEAFLEELRDTYNCEKQLTKALPKMAKAAASSDLKTAFEKHLEETEGHVERLERVFSALDEKVRGKHCKGVAGIIEEGNAMLQENFDETTTDAMLIAAAQRVEHYEMAAYGTLVSWAKAMGHEEAADILHETLEEEKAADEKLTTLAEGGINQEAADGAHSEGPHKMVRARGREKQRAARRKY
jgi:ferritin-like metal-binding protein YciE